MAEQFTSMFGKPGSEQRAKVDAKIKRRSTMTVDERLAEDGIDPDKLGTSGQDPYLDPLPNNAGVERKTTFEEDREIFLTGSMEDGNSAEEALAQWENITSPIQQVAEEVVAPTPTDTYPQFAPKEVTPKDSILREKPETANIQALDPRGNLGPRRPNDWTAKLDAMWTQTTIMGNLGKYNEMIWKKAEKDFDTVVPDRELYSILLEGYNGKTGGLDYNNTYLVDSEGVEKPKGSEFEKGDMSNTPTRVDAMYWDILAVKEKYGASAAKLRAQQMRDDVLNGKVIEDLSWNAALGYGALSMVLDPFSYVTGGVGAKTAQLSVKGAQLATRKLTGTAMATDVLTQSIRVAPRTYNRIAVGETLETMSKWVIGAGTESTLTNSARLMGDVTYTTRDLKNDVMMESMFGGGLGLLGGGWKANSRRMASRIDAKKRDVSLEIAAQRRENIGDKSNFEVQELVSAGLPEAPLTLRQNIKQAYQNQLLIKEDMFKFNKDTLRVSYNDMRLNAGGPNAKGIMGLNDSIMDTHSARLADADNTKKWLSNAALDTVTQLNGKWLHVRSLLDESTKITEGQELFDASLVSPLKREWDNINRQIKMLSNDYGAKTGATPEAIADNIQAVVYLNDKLSKLARDTEQDIMTSTQRQKYNEDNIFEATGTENVELDVIKGIVPETVWDNVQLDVELRSPVELPNSYSENLSELHKAMVKVHGDRKAGVSKVVKSIVQPSSKPWGEVPLTLRDVDSLTPKQLKASIDTIKNSPLVDTQAFKQSGILPKLHVMMRTMKGGDVEASKIASKLALDYVALASYYAKNLPMHVASKLKRVHFAKRKIHLNGALDNMVNPQSSIIARTELVDKYVKYMRQSDSMTALGDDIHPMSYDEMLNKNLDVMRADNVQGWTDKLDDWDEGIDREAFSTKASPVESTMGIIKQLNEDAIASANPAFIEAVNKLNGVVDKRLLDMELGTLKDPAQPYISRELSESETAYHLATQGWKRSDKGYQKEFNRVRKTGVEMTTDMRNALKSVLQDEDIVELLPQNIAMYNKENLLEVVNGATLKELRSRLHKNVLGPLEIYGKQTPDSRRLKKISKRKEELVGNATQTITNMINRGDVALLNDTIAAAASVRKDKLRAIADTEQKLKANKERQASVNEAIKDVETGNPEVTHAKALEIRDHVEVLRKAKSTLDNAMRRNPNGNMAPMNQAVAEANGKMAQLMKDMEDLTGGNSTALAALKRQETELLHELKLTKAELPESGSANALDAGNMDTIANNAGTGTPELEVPDEVIKAAAPVIASKAHNKVMQGLSDFAENELELAKLNVMPRSSSGWVGYHVGRALGLTQDLATTFQKSDSTVMQFLGHKVTEMGRGHAGANKRGMTGGVIREAEYTASVMQMIPGYTKAIDSYAASKGSKAIGRLRATTQNGANDATVDAFNREFFLNMNAQRLGKQMDTSPEMKQFMQEWNDYMDYNHGRLVETGIQGFTAEKKIKNYVPQIWNSQKMKEAWASNPYKVQELFVKGYRQAGHADPESLATRQIEYLRGMSDDMDQHMPNMEGRAKHQIKIDQSVEVEGLNMLDLLDTEVAKVGMIYSNRVAGHIGLAKSTDGMLTGLQDTKALRAVLEAEVGKGHQSLKDFDDVIDLMYGRPPQGGLQEWMRDFKDLAVLTKMGGLGTAQAIETGTIATRGLLEASADPKFLAKLTRGMSPEDTATDLQELMKMSGYSWDFEWLNRQSVHLDTKVTDTMGQLKAKGNELADFATFGKAKAPASRMLGKVSGYNAVRKYQSAAMQRSFGFAVARHFKSGNSKMSVGRMADLGLTDPSGVNSAMKKNITEHVEFDAEGYPTKYNFDKWDKDVRETFHYAMQRAEAQDMQRGLVGEGTRWMNKPLMQMIAQFRNMPLVAQNKSLARSMAFADREAATSLALNTMMAGLIRGAKIATIAGGASWIAGTKWESEFDRRWNSVREENLSPGNVDKYISQLGFITEATTLGVIAGDTWQRATSAKTGFEGMGAVTEAVLGQVPALSTMNSGFQTGKAIGEGDPAKAVEEFQGYAPLGNTQMVEWLFNGVENEMRK